MTKRILCGVAACVLGVGCSGADGTGAGEEEVGSVGQALDATKTQSLTLTGPGLSGLERERQTDTDAYYQSVLVGGGGTATPTLFDGIHTLNDFRTINGFSTGEIVTRYFNRGDLGIGREMHCVDKLNVTSGPGAGQVACYVVNFAAGDDLSEFTFGLSNSIAFTNAAKGHSFATVAMVYRSNASVPSDKKIYYVVFDAANQRLRTATLDRVGITFNNAFVAGGKFDNPPAATFGAPGVNFNNHIPSNCMACHGGGFYNTSTHGTANSVFLPFDLDQFDYATPPTQADLDAFKHQNEAVWRIAKALNNTSLTNQLNVWYANTSLQPIANQEVFEGSFSGARIPAAWDDNGPNEAFYTAVLRPTCRNCHMANFLPFNTPADFQAQLGTNQNNNNNVKNKLCGFNMPHALQTLRLFWQSSQPRAFADYLRATGHAADAADFNTSCGPKNVATLDPPALLAAVQPLF